MATNVIMPALGIMQETGKLLQWLKAEGEAVTQGELLMMIETDKATMEIEAPASGVLTQVTASVGDDVPVGQVIALIVGAAEAAPPPVQAAPAPVVAAHPDSSATEKVAASPLARRIAEENSIDLVNVTHTGDRIEKADIIAYLEQKASKETAPSSARLLAASPKARSAAKEHNVDIANLTGSGPDGAVLVADVLGAAKQAPAQVAAPPSDATAAQVVKPSTIWRIMADRTTQSWTTVPHFYLTREVNASRLITWRERAQKRFTEKITYTDLLVRLVSTAIVEHPRLNAMWKDGAIHMNPDVNIGLAVAVEDGLVVPVIQRAQTLSIAGIARQRVELVARSQSGKLRPSDISNGTFTISNLGMFGVDSFNAIVNPPQSAILAVGRIAQRVVAIDDRPAVQSMMTLTLSCDHRAVDGARGAQFLQTLADMIEEPLGLLD